MILCEKSLFVFFWLFRYKRLRIGVLNIFNDNIRIYIKIIKKFIL